MNIPHLHNTVIKNFFIYLLGAVCLGGFHILMAPINMRLLDPAQYGLLSLITSSITIGATLLGLGLRQFFSIEYFHHNEHGQKRLINQLIIIYAAFSIPVIMFIIFLRPYLMHILCAHYISPAIFYLTLGATFLSFFAELFYQVLKYRQQAWELIRTQIIIAIAALGTTIILLVWAKMGVISNVIGQCISMGGAACIGLYTWHQEKFHTSFTLNTNTKIAFEFLKKSIPFVPSILFGWIIASSDRFILAKYATLHDVGIYAIADMAGQMFRLLILQSWAASYLPSIMTQYHHHKDSLLAIEQKNLKTMWFSMAGLLLFFVAGYYISKPFLLIILPPHYHEALHYILLIITSHIFLLGSYFAASFIQYHKKTYFLAAAFCIPAIINLVLNLLLVHGYTIYGCTFATLISYAIYFVIIWAYNKKLRTSHIYLK